MPEETTTAPDETQAVPEGAQDPSPTPDASSEDTQDVFPREYVEKLRAEAAENRKRARELEERMNAEEEAKRKAALSAEERAREAEEKAERALAEANEKAARADRLVALAGKVTKPDRVLRLMDDPSEFFSEDGTPNEARIKEAFPEYMPRDSSSTSPVDAVRPSQGAPTKNPWARESLNLTEQARILKENPDLAERLKAAAKN